MRLSKTLCNMHANEIADREADIRHRATTKRMRLENVVLQATLLASLSGFGGLIVYSTRLILA